MDDAADVRALFGSVPAKTDLVLVPAPAHQPPERAPQTTEKAPPREAALAAKNSVGRTGAFYLPSGYASRRLPMLVAIHGTGGDGRAMVGLFRAAAEQEGFIVVAPDSRIAPNGQASWEVADRPGETTADHAHIRRCVDEVLALPGVTVDRTQVLVAGHSGGRSTAPYEASVEGLYTAFAVLHGGVFVGGLGLRRPRGWFSTGAGDSLRPPRSVQGAVAQVKGAGFADVAYREFPGGHEVGPEELRALLGWWLRT
jgi:phospholipase/carboxylesterase